MSNAPTPGHLGSTSPLRGGEEKEFIYRCVHQLMIRYAAVFGVANLVAVGALFFTVYQAANTAAKSEAQDYVEKQLGKEVQDAEKLVDQFVDLAKKVTDTASDRISQFDKEYPHLLATKERLETDLTALQKSLETVKILADKTEAISQLTGLALALKKFIDDGNDVSKLLGDVQLENEIVKNRVTVVEVGLNQKVSKEELQTSRGFMSTQKVYRIRSEIGDWFACINATAKGTLALLWALHSWV